MAAPADLTRLYGVLENTYSAEPVTRKAAEAELDAAKASPGPFLLALLAILAQSGVAAREVRQAGAIALKNLIKSRWDKRFPANAPALQVGGDAALLLSDGEYAEYGTQVSRSTDLAQ